MRIEYYSQLLSLNLQYMLHAVSMDIAHYFTRIDKYRNVFWNPILSGREFFSAHLLGESLTLKLQSPV